MNPMQWVLVGLLILGILVLVMSIILTKKKKAHSSDDETNYLTFFILGITFLPMGVVMSISIDNPGFYGIAGMGAIFFIIGLANRDKWNDQGKQR